MKQNLDQYYTQPKDADLCIKQLKQFVNFEDYDVILEPSCGAGAFSDLLPSDKRIALDLEPKVDYAKQLDFFDYSPEPFKKILTIGNPPFGRRGKLAKEFIHKASTYSDTIAFILPAIFNKYTFINGMPKNFHLVNKPIAIDTFVFPNGTKHEVNCVFQIWQNKGIQRPKIIKPTTHKDFTIRHAHLTRITEEEHRHLVETSTFVIGQVSNKISDSHVPTKGSQYYIKDNTPQQIVRQVFEKADLSKYNQYSMGATSLSQADIIEIYQEFIA